MPKMNKSLTSVSFGGHNGPCSSNLDPDNLLLDSNSAPAPLMKAPNRLAPKNALPIGKKNTMTEERNFLKHPSPRRSSVKPVGSGGTLKKAVEERACYTAVSSKTRQDCLKNTMRHGHYLNASSKGFLKMIPSKAHKVKLSVDSRYKIY